MKCAEQIGKPQRWQVYQWFPGTERKREQGVAAMNMGFLLGGMKICWDEWRSAKGEKWENCNRKTIKNDKKETKIRLWW